MLRFLTSRSLRLQRRGPRLDPAAKAGAQKPRPDGAPVALIGQGAASDYAAALLRDLGLTTTHRVGRDDPHPALDWARSGAMALTGFPDGPPELAPCPLASCTRGTLRAVRLLAERAGAGAQTAAASGVERLAERAAVAGLRRRGRISPSGTCRLIATRDGFVALNLARPDDVALLPAWLEGPAELAQESDPWRELAARIATRHSAEWIERGRWMGLAVAPAWPAETPPAWLALGAAGTPRERPRPAHPLVVDLSQLWAGPLCASLLGVAGARVIKVESAERPDGTRFGPPAFFDRLNGDKRSVVLRLGTERGRESLRALLEAADIIVESSRPRALQQLGIDAAEWVRRRSGLTWVSITGYGREKPRGDWVAFGDDASAAAGLVAATGSATERPIFCADAVADPLTGMHAAAAALASQAQGGGHLLDVSMVGVVARVLHFAVDAEPASVHRTRNRSRSRSQSQSGWEVCAGAERADVLPPTLPPKTPRSPAFGGDTEDVLRELGAC